VSANKFKEDVKFDNFKRHTVIKQATQGLQVQEKKLQNALVANI